MFLNLKFIADSACRHTIKLSYNPEIQWGTTLDYGENQQETACSAGHSHLGQLCRRDDPEICDHDPGRANSQGRLLSSNTWLRNMLPSTLLVASRRIQTGT